MCVSRIWLNGEANVLKYFAQRNSLIKAMKPEEQKKIVKNCDAREYSSLIPGAKNCNCNP